MSISKIRSQTLTHPDRASGSPQVAVKTAESVGLSYYPLSGRKLTTNPDKATDTQALNHAVTIGIESWKTGELRLKVVSSYSQNLTTPTTGGRQAGSELVQHGITRYAQSQIKRAARHIQNVTDTASFITLTYGKAYPDQKTTKTHLYHFLKRLRREYGNVFYVWVTELQKRGAPHFHILTDRYVEKEWLNQAWNEIVQKWQKKAGKKLQTVLPNVQGVQKAGAYMAKYISKEKDKIHGNMYAISKGLHDYMKPARGAVRFQSEYSDIKAISNDISISIQNCSQKAIKTAYFESQIYGTYNMWLSCANDYLLTEFLKYHLPDIVRAYQTT